MEEVSLIVLQRIWCPFVRDKRSIIVAALRPIWGKEGAKWRYRYDKETDRSNPSRQFGRIDETGFLWTLGTWKAVQRTYPFTILIFVKRLL